MQRNMRFKISRVLVFISILACVSCSYVSPKNGIYLMPKGYTGDIIIIFNQPFGVTPEVENGLIVYRIPTDGILKVKTGGVSGYSDKSYFYFDENNKRQKLKKLRITGERDPSGKPKDKFDGQITRDEHENKVFVMNTGGLGSFQTKKGNIQFTSFVVGAPKDSEILYSNMQKRISRMQKELIEN